MARIDETDEEREQWLPDGEGGSLEPERNESLDLRIEEYLEAKESIAESRETMKLAKEQMLAIFEAARSDGKPIELPYVHHYRDQTFRMEVTEEWSVSIQAVKTD